MYSQRVRNTEKSYYKHAIPLTARPKLAYNAREQPYSIFRTFGGRSRQELTWMYPQRVRKIE